MEQDLHCLKNLLQALLEIAKEVDPMLIQDGRNEEDDYTFTTNQTTVLSVREAMLQHGVICLTSTLKSEVRPERVQVNEGERTVFFAQVDLQVTFTHVATGESLTIVMPGSGLDDTDKGLYKAITGAKKYALREAFMLASCDDPEKVRNTLANAKKRAAAGAGTVPAASKEPPKERAQRGKQRQEERLEEKFAGEAAAKSIAGPEGEGVRQETPVAGPEGPVETSRQEGTERPSVQSGSSNPAPMLDLKGAIAKLQEKGLKQIEDVARVVDEQKSFAVEGTRVVAHAFMGSFFTRELGFHPSGNQKTFERDFGTVN